MMVECEIMEVILQEASKSYASEIVHAVRNVTVENMESTVVRVVHWYDAFREKIIV